MDKATHGGILAAGYGIVPKAVMKDTSLSPEAKAIYAYICAYAGNDGSAFPSVGLMAHELGMSEARLKKHRAMLVKAGYLTIESRRSNGKQASNLYIIELQTPCFQTQQNLPPENLTPENVPPTINNGTSNSHTKNSEDKARTAKKHKYGEYWNVLLTDEDLSKLQTEFPNDWQSRIERLSEYMASTGKSYKNHLATIRNWAKREYQKQPKKQAKYNNADEEYFKTLEELGF